MYRRILIATDGSELAGRGVEQGLSLAAVLGAEVTLLTVSEPWATGFDDALAWSAGPSVLADYRRACEESARAILDAAAARAREAGVPHVALHVPDRYPAEAIVETAESGGSDLIVIASHGRRGLGRLLIGSQTQAVLTHSRIPVLVVR